MQNAEIYEFEPHMGEELLEMFLGVAGLVLFAVLAFWVVGYVLRSLGLYTIAKRRGIHNPWLAWLPVGDYWITGSISDQYHYVTRGEVKNRRIVLLVLSIASAVLSGIGNAAVGAEMLGNFALSGGEDGAYVIRAVAEMGFINLLSSGVRLALLIFWHMTLFDVYSSCDQRYSVVYLVLGVIFGFTVPFFLFACRRKDYGMPPRRDEYQADPEPWRDQADPEPRTYRDPWENE